LRGHREGLESGAMRPLRLGMACAILRPMTTVKRLYRSRAERMLSGVCGGAAEYLGIDPVIVRVLWVVAALLGGAGLLAYVLCWLLVPEEPAST